MPLRSPRTRLLASVSTFAVAGAVVLVVGPSSADAATRASVVSAAAAYGPAHGYKVGVAVLDTKTGAFYGSGSYKSTFASESVVKTMIATRILLQGRMHGSTATRAYKMITQSDDTIASSFYGSVGGDGLITWIKNHYHVSDLGSPPHRAGWWGNTHITAAGLVKFYAKVKKDKLVGPWLINAMHHATTHGSDGVYQFFGIPSATTGFAVKQGWGTDYDDWGKSADFNTTGFVNSDRYAVAILGRGPVSTYGSRIGAMLTQTAKRLLPGGHFPDGTPTVTGLSSVTGKTAGGQRVTVHGTDFTHVSYVVFGGYKATALKVVSSSTLQVTTPKHAPARISVRVVTDHGTSSTSTGRFTYIPPATITQVYTAHSPTTGKVLVHVNGSSFVHVSHVYFGSTPGTGLTVSSTTKSLTVLAPAHAAGTVNIRVVTWYGWSPVSPAAAFTYVP